VQVAPVGAYVGRLPAARGCDTGARWRRFGAAAMMRSAGRTIRRFRTAI